MILKVYNTIGLLSIWNIRELYVVVVRPFTYTHTGHNDNFLEGGKLLNSGSMNHIL